ncbi:Non-specific serine/threonine protein kinase [Bertholletia excelsa]
MELLSPTRPPDPAGDRFSRFSPPASFQRGFDRTTRTVTPQPREIVEEAGTKVYVALGKSLDKAIALLRWTFERFGCGEICILHVHQPSPVIPTLLGKLPANQASSEVVSAYRREEREQMKKLLFNYQTLCAEFKVRASLIVTEGYQVQKGIVDLVKEHGIRKLVIGAVPENCTKLKKSSKKASYAAKNAPDFCEIWFVSKGKHVWTREACQGPNIVESSNQPETCTSDNLVSGSLQHNYGQIISHSDYSQSGFAATREWVQAEASQAEITLVPTSPSDPHYFHCLSSSTSTSSSSGYSFADQRMSSASSLKVDEESLLAQLAETRKETKASRNEALQEFLKRKGLEANATEIIGRAKALDSACAYEIKLRQEAEDALRVIIQEQEKLTEEREEITRELEKAMRHIALLDSQAVGANHRREEASGELRLLKASIAALQHEKQKIRRQKMKASHWLDSWRSRRQAGGVNYNGLIGFAEDLPEVTEFSLSDLQTATCNFSDSFKIGQSGSGSVYKGEMLNQTVAIKKLHPQNIQGQSEFQQEIQILGKLRHPHLVTLIGVCPEAWSLVYEYLPNGSLLDCLSQRSNFSLNWKIRVRIVAEIASALLFLHSFKPEKIVHGNLKPENILLDSDLSCKICDFGISRLMTKEGLRCPSFRQYTEPKGAFSYTDPELNRTGALTSKSDSYSFGMIILHLLTGRAPETLAAEVRKAVSCGKLDSLLDSSAGEWPNFVLKQLVDLGLQCCEPNARDRPNLTPSIIWELEQLHSPEERTVPSFFLCPIRQEIMHDPQVAADGFTYEGEALREWFGNGHETSPMTNLKLEHLHLTPNHALRLAIQDWLCKA